MKKLISLVLTIFLFAGCSDGNKYLRESLKAAGENRAELEAVLNHYKYEDKDPLKLKAAEYLISNMPGHYSYADTARINEFYRIAVGLLGTGPNPDWQRDTTSLISRRDFPDLLYSPATVPDVEIMKADYLINNIDLAFKEWKGRPWSYHLTFDEFCSWILPYKAIELQTLDNWREVLSAYYCDSINKVPADDVQRNSIWGAIEIVRNEIQQDQYRIGHRVIWDGPEIIPLRNADAWTKMTYGNCIEYVTMGISVYRSLGLPAAVDAVPIWGRNRAGHCWYVFPSDNGIETQSQEEMIYPAGMQFYPYERLPKVYRMSYAINRDVEEYNKKAKFVHKFDLCREDVTDHYCRTSDIDIDLLPGVKPKDKYVYIAMFGVLSENQWEILDFGKIKNGKAHFNKMGRDIQYIVLGYNGQSLVPMSYPFILEKNGSVRYIICDESNLRSVTLKRKYYQSYNVVDMRRRLLGGRIQCSNRSDFKDALTLFTIETTDIPDKISVKPDKPYRYWRYMSPDGSWGSVAEVAFFDADAEKISGRGIANAEAGQDAIDRAYDNDWLTNFEINQPDGNWIGIDMGKPGKVNYVRIIPRSDDNDVHPGQEYELCYLNSRSKWKSLGRKVADDNFLQFDSVPNNCLLWLINHTCGFDERPFIYYDRDSIEWR